jgi:AAA domain
MPEFTSSSKRNPCPVCERTKDGDCRSLEEGNVVLCHSYLSGTPDERINGYKFLRPSKDGLWGVFVYHVEDQRGHLRGYKALRKRPARQSWDYVGRNGEPLIRVLRINKEGDRSFSQHRWSGAEWVKGLNDYARQNVPCYRYPEVQAAIAQGQKVFVVEGEDTADAFYEVGLVATTFLGGSKKYRSFGDYSQDLKGAEVVLCPDRDKVGVEHMEEIAKDFPDAPWCFVYPQSPVWQGLPDFDGLDARNWINAGATAEDILKAVKARDSKESKTDDSPADRKIKHDRIVTEWERIASLQEASLQHLERVMLSQREKLPLREVEIIGKRSRQNKPLTTISTKALCEQPDQNAGDLIESVLENGVSLLLFAQSKAGKTPLLYDLAYSVATGEAWMEQFKVPEPGGVLLLQSDETERASKKNFRRRGLHHLENVEFSKEFTIDDIPRLVRRIEELKQSINLKLVGVDSLTTINADNSFGENDAEFARDLYRLARAVTDAGVTLIVTHHRRKNSAMGELDSAAGSGRIVAAVDDVWALHRMSKKEDKSKLKRVLERVAAHDGELFRWVIQLHLLDRAWSLEGEYDAEAHEGDRVVDFVPPAPIPKNISERITQFINQSDAVWECTDLAHALNLNENTVRKELPKLAEKGHIDHKKADYRVGNGRFAQHYFAKKPPNEEMIQPRNDPPEPGIISQTQAESELREMIPAEDSSPPKILNGDRASVW